MALRLAGERALVIQGADNQGWVREVTIQDSLPGLKVNQNGAGRVFDFQDGGASKMYLPDGGNVNLVGSLVFDLANDVTITPANPAAPRTLTLPAVGGDRTFAFLEETQTLSAKTLAAPSVTGTVTESTNAKRLVVQKTGIVDNVVTGIARISTTNEAGSNDAGAYTVFVRATVIHNANEDGSTNAAKAFYAAFAGIVHNDTGVHTASAITEIAETASAAGAAATRDVGAVTMTVNVGTARQADIEFQVDLTGTLINDCKIVLEVTILWATFITPPTLSAL